MGSCVELPPFRENETEIETKVKNTSLKIICGLVLDQRRAINKNLRDE